MSTGILYLVATPIGNLDDITKRASDVLRRADLVACEDTRVTGRLLKHIGSGRPTISYHEHNERQRAEELIGRLVAGESIALVSDAGTPALNDPGFCLIRECRRQGLPVESIPGPSAFLSALVSSGLPTHAFFFSGFLPPKTHGRKKLFEQHKTADYTLIAYESCHRITKSVSDIETVCGGERTICLARELTKRFESVWVGTVSNIAPKLVGRQLKGEFVVLIAPEAYVL